MYRLLTLEQLLQDLHNWLLLYRMDPPGLDVAERTEDKISLAQLTESSEGNDVDMMGGSKQ
eukprot:754494-Hanusia_phi.AAC.3